MYSRVIMLSKMALRGVIALIFYLAIASAKESSAQYDTIVVGLGAAGVTAASTLAKAGRKVLGLEAQDRIGGRVNTVPFGDGVVELGAEWIHGQYPSRVYDTAVQNNITVLPQDQTVAVYRSDGTPCDRKLLNDLIAYCSTLLEVFPNVQESWGSYITRKIKDHLKETRPELLKNEDKLEELLSFMDLMVDNYEGSNSWNKMSTITNFEEIEGESHLSWHRYGYKTFFELLLNTYQGGPGVANLDIKLNTEVTKIVWPQQPSTPVEVTCKDGKVYTANNVIVTVSIGVLKERYSTLFEPRLPQEKVLAIERLSIWLVDKVVLAFPKVKWPGTNFIFQYTKEEREKIVKEKGLITTSASMPMGSSDTITLWFSGETAKLVETLPEEVVKRKSWEILQMFLGANMTIPEPIGLLRSTWYSNPYTRGSYSYDSVSSLKYPNSRADLGKPLLDSAGTPKVLFAGEATDLTQFSTVHGASESGYREAMRLLPSKRN